MRSKELPPFAPTLMESTRAIGYSTETAVADIVDNSIAAGASRVDISYFPKGDSFVSILDNGCAMDETELDRAMQYGSQNPEEKRGKKDLGRFGLGLKTASMSQCRRLSVVTKRGDTICGRQWDLDHIKEAGSWSLLILDAEDMESLPNFEQLDQQKVGTLVVWQCLDRMERGHGNIEQAMTSKMDDVGRYLSLIYHRYLAGEQGIKRLTITMNGRQLSPIDPFLEGKSTPAMDDEVLMIRRAKIVVRPYILPHISKLTSAEMKALGGKEGLRKGQGFYIYRNKRLLVWGTWFRMMMKSDLSKLARVRVDIPNTLDDLWTLDIKKSTAIPPVQVQQQLKALIEKIAEGSKRTWTYRGKKETSDKVVHLWDRMKNRTGGFFYEINREHPLVQQLKMKFPEADGFMELLLRHIEQGLPLNQLYVDMTSDEKITNNDEADVTMIESSLRSLLEIEHSSTERLEMLRKLKNVSPFAECPAVVEKMENEVRKA